MGYHFVWCSKYRRLILVEHVAKRVEELIRQKARKLNCKIIALEIMPDYVHLFIQGTPQISPNSLIGQIKGHTSRILRKEYKELRTRLPTLWTRSYFVSTHKHISDKRIEKYIEKQKGV